MASIRNNTIVEYTKEITIAMLSNTDTRADGPAGQKVAEFMQAVYDKLVELAKETD